MQFFLGVQLRIFQILEILNLVVFFLSHESAEIVFPVCLHISMFNQSINITCEWSCFMKLSVTREFINIRCRKQRQNSKIPVNTFVYEIVRIDTPCFSRRYNIKNIHLSKLIQIYRRSLKTIDRKSLSTFGKSLTTFNGKSLPNIDRKSFITIDGKKLTTIV